MARRALIRWCRHLEPKVIRQFQRPWLRWAGAWLIVHGALDFRRRPLALGVAIGVFCGLIPGPLKLLAALWVSTILRGNAIAAMAATSYINPLTIVPAYLLAYRIGSHLLPGRAAALSVPAIEWGSVSSMMNLGHWVMSMGWPLLLGLLVLGSWLSINAYWLVNYLWLRPVRARAKRMRSTQSSRV
jgi:uncharacterized protein